MISAQRSCVFGFRKWARVGTLNFAPQDWSGFAFEKQEIRPDPKQVAKDQRQRRNYGDARAVAGCFGNEAANRRKQCG